MWYVLDYFLPCFEDNNKFKQDIYKQMNAENAPGQFSLSLCMHVIGEHME